ncbi:hypothetical protein H0A36_28115, partial [Endozoicomonas sp. SM1973]
YKTTYPSAFFKLLGVGQEKYCRALWRQSNTAKKARWGFIGNRQNGRPVTTLLDFKLQAEKWIPEIGDNRCSVDVYFSPAEFFNWRRTRQLARLHATWIEIDLVEKAQDYSAEVEDEVVKEVFAQIAQSGLPMPTGYVLSGSGGVHLYWAYEAVEAYRWRVRQWRLVSRAISKCLTGGRYWQVDKAATHGPARVLRAPGTIHGRTGRTVVSKLGGPFYTFDSLANQLGILTEPPKKKDAQSKEDYKRNANLANNGNPNHNDQSKQTRKHTIGKWWAKTYYHVLNNIQQGVSVGKRNNTAFILFIALKHMMSEEKALEQIKTINNRLIKLPEEELLRNLSTARKVHYKFRKASLAVWLDTLGISSNYLFVTRKPAALNRGEIKQRQVLAARKVAQVKQQRTLMIIGQAIENLVEAGIKATQKSIAQVASVSVRTVQRYWGALKGKDDISSTLYISPPYASI